MFLQAALQCVCTIRFYKPNPFHPIEKRWMDFARIMTLSAGVVGVVVVAAIAHLSACKGTREKNTCREGTHLMSRSFKWNALALFPLPSAAGQQPAKGARQLSDFAVGWHRDRRLMRVTQQRPTSTRVHLLLVSITLRLKSKRIRRRRRRRLVPSVGDFRSRPTTSNLSIKLAANQLD